MAKFRFCFLSQYLPLSDTLPWWVEWPRSINQVGDMVVLHKLQLDRESCPLLVFTLMQFNAVARLLRLYNCACPLSLPVVQCPPTNTLPLPVRRRFIFNQNSNPSNTRDIIMSCVWTRIWLLWSTGQAELRGQAGSGVAPI